MSRNRVAVGRFVDRLPKVAVLRQPWALGHSPVGADGERDSASRSSFARGNRWMIPEPSDVRTWCGSQTLLARATYSNLCFDLANFCCPFSRSFPVY